MSFGQVTCLVGTFYVFYLSLKFLKFTFEVVKTFLFGLGGIIDFKHFGKWAVVTGCTDGIGKEYAKQLAAKGLNIVLMSRSKEKLVAVASEIENEYKVKTKIIQVDFSGGHEIYKPIGKELEELEIGILVNNVGVASGRCPNFLHEFATEIIWKQINVNVMAAAMLTRLIIPSMAERKKGIIINVGSFATVGAVPLLGAYSATKAFTDKFSETLDMEYGDKGIIIQCVLPLKVATNMSTIKEPGLFSPYPDSYVRSVLKKVGAAKRCFGYWPHELQAFLFSILPDWVKAKLIFKTMMDLREKAIKES